MPRFPPRPDYQALPWRQIREQYKTTDVSLRALAMQWNIASKTTITRRITDEGWTRRIAYIATTLELLQVAEASDPSPAPKASPRRSTAAPCTARRTPPPS